MTKQELLQHFESFNGKKILILGDVMVDAYLWGRVDRISPEAPVPVVTSSKRESRLGGAANVALNIKALGAVPFMCTLIGNDAQGAELIQLVVNEQMPTEGILTHASRVTTAKTRIMSGNQQLLRVDDEIDTPLSAELEIRFIEHIKQLMSANQFDAIIFQDYDKGVLTPLVISEAVALANTKGIPTLVDPKKRNFRQYGQVTLFKPNFKELTEGLKIEIRDKSEFDKLFDAAKQLHADGIKLVMVTLSENGVLISNGNLYQVVAAHKRDITDVSGAGDTVISVASLCLAVGLSEQAIAGIANLAGGLVCEKVGVVPIDKKRLTEEAQKLDFIE